MLKRIMSSAFALIVLLVVALPAKADTQLFVDVNECHPNEGFAEIYVRASDPIGIEYVTSNYTAAGTNLVYARVSSTVKDVHITIDAYLLDGTVTHKSITVRSACANLPPPTTTTTVATTTTSKPKPTTTTSKATVTTVPTTTSSTSTTSTSTSTSTSTTLLETTTTMEDTTSTLGSSASSTTATTDTQAQDTSSSSGSTDTTPPVSVLSDTVSADDKPQTNPLSSPLVLSGIVLAIVLGLVGLYLFLKRRKLSQN